MQHGLRRRVSVFEVNQSFGLLETLERVVGGRRRFAAHEAQLRELRAGAQDDRKRPRNHFHVELALVPLRHLFELQIVSFEIPAALGHQPRENIQPSGRAFRICRAADIKRQGELLDHRNDEYRVSLEQRRPGQIVFR